MRCSSARMASAVSMGVSAGMENVGAADGIKHVRTALSMSPQSMMLSASLSRLQAYAWACVSRPKCVQKLFSVLLHRKEQFHAGFCRTRLRFCGSVVVSGLLSELSGRAS